MDPIDKKAMGERVKRIRLEAGLRQWQLAELLGTTQSAVHKYEHGVIPEPRRLVELARIGGTTLEWILTGSHWEDGDRGKERLPEEVYRVARLAASLAPDRLRDVSEALEMLDRAARRVGKATGEDPDEVSSEDLADGLRDLAVSRRTLRAIVELHRCLVEGSLELETRRCSEAAASTGPAGRGGSGA